MTDETAANDQPITGNVLFYSRPEPLNREAHAKLGVRLPEKPFSFAQNTHIVPLVVSEFSLAGLNYPVIFVGEQRQPVAVMGLNAGENLYIDDGQFDAESYVPAFMRRYPFVLAADENNEQMVVCIDRDAPMFVDGGETPLFVEGEPSSYTKESIQFCNDFEVQRRLTETFVSLVKDLDLLQPSETNFTPRNPDGSMGAPQKVAEYFTLSMEKLNALPSEKIVELRDNGALQQIYAQMASLALWDRLFVRQFRRQGRPLMGGAATNH